MALYRLQSHKRVFLQERFSLGKLKNSRLPHLKNSDHSFLKWITRVTLYTSPFEYYFTLNFLICLFIFYKICLIWNFSNCSTNRVFIDLDFFFLWPLSKKKNHPLNGIFVQVLHWLDYYRMNDSFISIHVNRSKRGLTAENIHPPEYVRVFTTYCSSRVLFFDFTVHHIIVLRINGHRAAVIMSLCWDGGKHERMSSNLWTVSNSKT